MNGTSWSMNPILFSETNIEIKKLYNWMLQSDWHSIYIIWSGVVYVYRTIIVGTRINLIVL